MILDNILHTEEEFKQLINENKPINTIYGKFGKDNQGYYTCHSHRLGSTLHRILFEDFYMIYLPKNFIVRFIDGNKKNICIQNLQAVERSKLSKNNFVLKPENKLKISKSKNKLGIFRVTKHKNNYNKKFHYIYTYQINKKRKSISRQNLKELKNEVLNRGLPWIEFGKGETNE